MKTCSVCKETKPFKDFYKNRAKKDGYQYRCKDCSKVGTQKRYRTKLVYDSADKKRDRHLRTKYGIDINTYNDLLSKQHYRCAICGIDANDLELCVDHCHNTKEIRGLLCKNCNFGIGHFKDSPALLQAAIEYLSKDYSHDANGKA